LPKAVLLDRGITFEFSSLQREAAPRLYCWINEPPITQGVLRDKPGSNDIFKILTSFHVKVKDGWLLKSAFLKILFF